MTALRTAAIRCSLTLAVILGAALPGLATEAIPVAEVAAGMRGVCVTEMDGGERVEFPVTVLGTVGAAAPERDFVLVRLDDERFRHTGVIAGMSGSPVYLDGRLLGAVAYGWTFSKDPIAGVQPFERMAGLKAEDDGGSRGASPAATSGPPPALAELAAGVSAGGLGRRVVDWLLPAVPEGLQRLPLVVSAAGLGEPTDWLADGFRRLGWLGVPGSTAGDAAVAAGASSLEPGGMVAAVLVEGDASLAIGGTVTEVRGDDVWAFGHTVLGAGRVTLPMARAQVVAVLPSAMQSFKFFTVAEVLGAFEADRYHGSWGRLGATVDLLPVTVAVDGRDYHFRTVRHEVLTPLLAAYLAQTTYATHGRTFGGQTVALDVGLDYPGRPRVAVRQLFSGGDAAAQAAAYAAAVVAYVETSAFDGPEPSGLSIGLTSREALAGAEIVEAVPDRWTVAPGESFGVRVRLRARGGAERVVRLELEVPSRLADGRLDLVVADGASWSAYDLRQRPPRPDSFADELAVLGRLEPSGRVVAALERPQPGVVMGDSPLPAPAGVVLQLKAGLGPNLGATAWGVVGRAAVDLEQPVSGAVRLTLTVDAAVASR